MRGSVNWDRRDLWYVQTRSAIENILRKENTANFGQSSAKYWLETCGPHTAVNMIQAVGGDVQISTPGNWAPRPPDVLSLYFNDPRNEAALKGLGIDVDPSAVMDNEIAEYYPLAVSTLFGAKASLVYTHDFTWLLSYLDKGCALQLCLVKPGHFIGVTAYDETTNELVYVDPDPDRHPDGNWYQARMGQDEFMSNTKEYAIVYQPAVAA